MDSRSSTMKFYILALQTIQLLASSPFGLCGNADRVRITPSLGLYKRLRQLRQIESTFPYGIITSPPPPLSGAMPPNPVNSPPYGIYNSPPPTPTTPTPLTPIMTMPPPLLSTSPPPPPSPSAQSPPHNAPTVLVPPPNSHSSPTPPAPSKKPENAVWCVAKPTVPADLIQQALDYACGSGAGCEAIQPNGVCYQPATLISHASYAFNSYWQKRKQGGGTCDFGGTAMLVTVDPSYNQCHFMSN